MIMTASRDDILFAHFVEEVSVRGERFRLCLIKDLDEAIDHYARLCPSDTDKIPYFTRLWESGQALSEYLLDRAGLLSGWRVLELGCGLGLPSLCAARCGARVTATDFHPDSQPFFRRNAALNGVDVEHHLMDWRAPDLSGSFDLILGSDLIYERHCLNDLALCVERLLAPDGIFLYADPGRAALQDLAHALKGRGLPWELTALPGDIFLLIFSRARPWL